MNDLINGLFELGGGILIWLNVLQLYKDKETKGVHWVPISFFMFWGYWNLHYYPSLNQMLSFIGGIFVVTANTVWVGQMLYYSRKNEQKNST